MRTEEYMMMVLGEECSEVAQMCSKINRFGLLEVFPEQLDTNRLRMHKELDDLMAMIEILNADHDFAYTPCRSHIEAKKNKVFKYLKYSQELGLIDYPHKDAEK